MAANLPPHPLSYPIACDECARLTHRPYTQFIYDEWRRRSLCADCARWVSEAFTPIAVLFEAQQIIRAHQLRRATR